MEDERRMNVSILDETDVQTVTWTVVSPSNDTDTGHADNPILAYLKDNYLWVCTNNTNNTAANNNNDNNSNNKNKNKNKNKNVLFQTQIRPITNCIGVYMCNIILVIKFLIIIIIIIKIMQKIRIYAKYAVHIPFV